MEMKHKKKIRWVKGSVKSLILFLLLHNAFFLLVTVSFADYALSIAMKVSKYSYITLENIIRFVFSPMTVISIILILLLVSFFFYFEFIALSVYFRTKDTVTQMKVTYIIFPGFCEAICLLKQKKNLLLPLFSAISCICYALPLLLAMMFRQRMAGYVLQRLMDETIVLVIAVMLCFIMLILSYQGMFVCFYLNSGTDSLKTSFQKSKQLIKQHRKQIAWNLFYKNCLLCLFYLVLYWLIITLIGIVTFFVVEDKLVSVTFLTLYDQLNRYFGPIVGVIGIVVNLKIMYDLFLRYQKHAQIPEQVQLIQEKVRKDTRYTKYLRIISVSFLFVIGVVFAFGLRKSMIFQRNSIFGSYITAHRGYSSLAPENTIPSIQEAINAMSDYVEIDVQETKDGVVVLLHDSNLKRTTGVNKNIWNVTYEELQAYNAAKNFKGSFEVERIPTLEEVLLLCQNQIFLNIEIKITNHEQQLVEEVVRLIEDYDMEEQCVISSTNYNALTRVKNINESIKTGYIMTLAYGYFYNKENVDFFSVKSSFITQDMVKLSHSAGKEIHAWTVNDISEIRRMKQIGVDNIITDYPILVREVIYEDETTTSFLEFMKTIMN